MSTDRDMTRVVRSWLRTDEHESTDRVLDNVFAMLDTTPQRRRPLWPARRLPIMNTYAKLAIAAAAVVAVALVGLRFLPSGPGATNTSPRPSADAFPSPGPVGLGLHTATVEGVPLSFMITQTGWSADAYETLGKGTFSEADGSMLIFWTHDPDNVYSDPCAHTPLNPPPAHTAAALAAAVSTLPGTDLVSGPTSAVIDGHPGQRVVIKIRDDIGCDPGDFYRWYDDETGGPRGGYRNASDLGATISVWIIDVDGKIVWLDGETYAGADAARGQELEGIIESLKFN